MIISTLSIFLTDCPLSFKSEKDTKHCNKYDKHNCGQILCDIYWIYPYKFKLGINIETREFESRSQFLFVLFQKTSKRV